MDYAKKASALEEMQLKYTATPCVTLRTKASLGLSLHSLL